MEDDDWVLVRPTPENDWWSPSSVVVESESRPLKVTFALPAKHWTDAVPIGNGRLGAMVWGGVASEIIQLNEDTLWTGVPGNYTNPDTPKTLSVVRKLVDDSKYAEATEAAVKLSGNPSDVYQLVGDINLKFESHDSYTESTYKRELDLDTGTLKIQYSVGDIEFTREHFASNPDQVIVTKLSGSKPGSLSFIVYLSSTLQHNLQVNDSNSQIRMEGSCPGKRTPPSTFENDNPKGIQFSSILDVQIGSDKGVIDILDNNKLKIEGADWVVMLFVASSSFDGPFIMPIESKKDPRSQCLSRLEKIKNLSYSDLYTHHLNDYQELFHRVSLQFSKKSNNVRRVGFLEMEEINPYKRNISLRGVIDHTIPTAKRVESFHTDEDPSLVELLFQFGRYLLISCSRPGTQVANLQGIWNKDINPAWDGAPHLNINLQMNYWPSLPCNLSECQEPLFDYISYLSVNGSKTANVDYKSNGWVAHQVSDIWAKTSPDRGQAVWALWPMGGAWLCTHLWEHYQYTSDRGFLESRAFPLLKGCASFLLDWLIPGDGKYLETNPSTSPEHTFIAPNNKTASVSYSTTMDMAIIREVFSAVVSAAEVLGLTDDDIVERIKKAEPNLLPIKVARDGSIMEWAKDFQDPEPHHRHLSHLFGLFPGHTITSKKTDLCKAADFTLHKRGIDGPGWSSMWKSALWARLKNSEMAYEMVKHLINLVDPDRESEFEGGLYSNLFTAHPPFQIDGNFGLCAAVSEMLVQSTMKDLYLLPALPRGKWPNGFVKGLKARGNVKVSISWSEGDLHEVGIWSKEERHSLKTLHYRENTATVRLFSGKIHIFNGRLKCVNTYCV